MSNKIFPTDTVSKAVLVAADLFLLADSADSNKVKDCTGTILNTLIRGIGGSVTVLTTEWMGLGAAKGRIIFTDATLDLIAFDTCAVKVGAGTPTQAQAADDLFVTGKVEIDGILYADGNIVMPTAGTIGIASGGNITFTDATVDVISILSAAVKVGNGTPTQAQVAEDLYVEGKLEVDGILYADSNLYVNGNIDWSAGNVWYVPIGANIQTYITAAASGDTLILGSGDYTITSELTIPKNISLNFIGQGIGKTKILCATDDIRMFVQTSNDANATFLRFEGMTLQHTGNGTKVECIFSENSSSTYYTRVDIKNIEILMTTSAEMHGIRLYRGGYLGKVDGLTIIGTSTFSSAPQFSGAGINVQFRSTFTGTISSYWTNVYVDVTTARADALSTGVYCYDHTSTGTQTFYLKDCFFKSRNSDVTYNSAAFYANGDGVTVVADRCSFDGDDADVYQSTSASVTLRDCIKVNNLTTGTISHSGVIATYGLLAVGGNIVMGSSTVNAGVFSMINGAVASDPTFSITLSGNNVLIAQTVGSLNLTAVGEVVINDASEDVDFRIETDASTHRFFVDGGLNSVGIIRGTFAGSPLAASATHFITAGASAGNLSVYYDHYGNDTNKSYLGFRKSLSDTMGTLARTGDGNFLAVFDFYGVDAGAAWARGALINVKQDGATSTYVPTNIIMQTCSGSALNTNQFVLHNDGYVGIGTDAPATILEVVQNQDAESTLTVTNTNTGSSARSRIIATNGSYSALMYANANAGNAYLQGVGGGLVLSAGNADIQINATANYEVVFNEDSVDADLRVESNGNANMLVVDGGLDAVGIGTAAISGFALAVAGTIVPATDDTYYLGKNDDDTPLAWKGVIVKDTTNGTYYRIEVINGTITATSLTD